MSNKDKPAGQDVAAKAKETGVAVQDFGEDSGRGLENIRRDEFSIPFLRILQPLSPQCKPVSQGGLHGAKAGMILNIATSEMYDGEKGITVMPVHREHNFPEWTPRDQGGGFVAIHHEDDDLITELRAKQGQFGKLITSEGNEIVEAYYLYCIAWTDEGPIGRCVVTFASTQIKKYKAFIQRATNFGYANKEGVMRPAPMWAHKWVLSTVGEQNRKGSFFGWRLSLAAKREDGFEEAYIKSLVPMSDPLYKQAKDFNELCRTGVVKVDHGKSGTGNEEVPFES